MAYDGIEVEIKVKAPDEIAEAIKNKLLEGTPTQIHHVDAYFDSKTKSFLSESPIKEWLSVRNRGDKIIINHKFWHFDENGKGTHSDESELQVNSVDDATRLLDALGFKPLITVNKHRTEGEIDGMLVSVDEVAELGYFVEIEATSSKGSIEETRRALKELATRLDLDVTKIDGKGYPHLLLEERLGHELVK